jgi:dihydroflavonol-4-reductase
MKTILVTGAAWCLGSNLVRKLAQTACDIHILIKPGTWHPFLDGLNVRVFYGDIRNKSDVIDAMQWCHEVYQVAGVVSYAILDNSDMLTTHVDGVKNVLDCARELWVGKVVVTWSTAGIGIPENQYKPLNEETIFDKKYSSVMYMYSKHCTIELCREYAQQGLSVVCVSPTTLYGPGDMKMHIGKMIKKIANNSMRFVPPGGNAVVSIDDTVDGHLLAMERWISGENYILADECMTYFDMFQRVAKLLGQDSHFLIIPRGFLPMLKFFCSLQEWLLYPFHRKPSLSPRAVNFTFKYRYFDASKARQDLGWIPKQSFEESIGEAISFYKNQNLL